VSDCRTSVPADLALLGRLLRNRLPIAGSTYAVCVRGGKGRLQLMVAVHRDWLSTLAKKWRHPVFLHYSGYRRRRKVCSLSNAEEKQSRNTGYSEAGVASL
jgi:hypothetical protein